MVCPKCGGATNVYNSRPYLCNSIMRRRECVECGSRFRTTETITWEIKKENHDDINKRQAGTDKHNR